MAWRAEFLGVAERGGAELPGLAELEVGALGGRAPSEMSQISRMALDFQESVAFVVLAAGPLAL